jgi:hypothetical protein
LTTLFSLPTVIFKFPNVMKGLPKKISVIETGGAAAGTYETEEQVRSGHLITGRSFLFTCSLPDVKPNTKIVGVCGIPDWNEKGDKKAAGLASPGRYGWFFSDFYLFHHLGPSNQELCFVFKYLAAF